MCGIFACNGEDTVARTVRALRFLEYRGYDSAGVATKCDGRIVVVKTVGRVNDLEKKLNNLNGEKVAIGHTRWATHGQASDVNAHPFVSYNKNFAIVHNGVIENYRELKSFLIGKNIRFSSETDSEVVAHLLEYYYSDDVLSTVIKVSNMLRGAFALAIISTRDDNIYAVKKGSPLVVGKGKNGLCVCSDVVGASNFSKTYAVVPNERIIKISGKKVTQYTFQKVSEKMTFSLCERTENYESTGEFMLKEIHEIPLLTRLFGLKAEEWRGEIISPDLLVGVTEIYLVGCGTAYNSCLVAKSVLTRHTKLCVQCFYASEFCYSQLPLSDHILTVAVSQSGETADTLKAVGVARDAGSKVVAITNVKNSSLSFVADCVLYIGAGREVAVASTKAYNLQVLTLILLSLKIALMREEISQYYFDEKCSILKDLSATVSATFSCESVVKEIADALAVAKSVFYLGRLSDYATAVEGSLKLKEISYIYSDAYPAGELKHGTLALVEKGVVCVIIATNRALLDKVQSTIAEVSARGASTIAVTPFVDEIVADKVIKLPITDEIFYPMISIIPLQLLAYYTALARGADIDKPRNLAKSVTVE